MRVGEIQGLQLGLFFQCLGDGLVERALHVGRLNLVLDDRRVCGRRSQALPGLGVERAARLEPVGLLKRGDRLFVIGPVLAVDLTRREAGAIEQHLALDGRRHAGSGSASLAGRRRHLGGIDRLRIEHGRGRGRLRLPPRPGVRRARHHQHCAGADKNQGQASADGGAPQAAPRRDRAIGFPGVRGSTTGGIIEHCHRQLLVSSKGISVKHAHAGGIGVPASRNTMITLPPRVDRSATRPPAANGLGRRGADMNFLDRREAKPDLNTAHSLVQWNFFARGICNQRWRYTPESGHLGRPHNL